MLPQQLYVQLLQYTHQYEHQSLWKKRRKILYFTAWSKKLFVYHYPLIILVDHPIKRFVKIDPLLHPCRGLENKGWPVQAAKTAVFPRSSPLGMSAPWPLKFHTDDVNQCFHNKSGSLGVPNVNLFCFMFPQSIMVKFCVLPRTSSSKTQMLLLKKYIHSSNIDCIVVYSSRLHLTFVAFCLLSVTHKQQL